MCDRRYDPPAQAEEEEQKPAVPTISRLDDAAVRPAVPELWQRLLRAPLTETLSVVHLNRYRLSSIALIWAWHISSVP
jgi:hypothetical protein